VRKLEKIGWSSSLKGYGRIWFKVYKDFKTSRHVIDIYGVLSTVVGDME